MLVEGKTRVVIDGNVLQGMLNKYTYIKEPQHNSDFSIPDKEGKIMEYEKLIINNIECPVISCKWYRANSVVYRKLNLAESRFRKDTIQYDTLTVVIDKECLEKWKKIIYNNNELRVSDKYGKSGIFYLSYVYAEQLYFWIKGDCKSECEFELIGLIPQAPEEEKSFVLGSYKKDFEEYCNLTSDNDICSWVTNSVFGLTTYDEKIDKIFCEKILQVCEAILENKTLDYIRDKENYIPYIILCNLFEKYKWLEWGSSIRVAEFRDYVTDVEAKKLCGFVFENHGVQFTKENLYLLLEFIKNNGET